MGVDKLLSCCALFWVALERREQAAAKKIQHAICPPLVDHDMYSYSTSPGEVGTASAWGKQGMLGLLVAPDTPKLDLLLWNYDKQARLFQLDESTM